MEALVDGISVSLVSIPFQFFHSCMFDLSLLDSCCCCSACLCSIVVSLQLAFVVCE